MKTKRLLLALACLLFLAGTGLTQPDTTSKRLSRDGSGNLTSTTVQIGSEVFAWNSEIAEMLDCTPEQRDEVQRVLEEFWEQQQSPRERPETLPQHVQRIDEMRNGINQIMKPEQQTQLREITFQLSGGLDAQFLDDRTLEVLELTDEQKSHIRQITEERTREYIAKRREMDRSHENLSGLEWLVSQREFSTNFANSEYNKKYAEQIKALLTPQQRARGEELTVEAQALRERLKVPLRSNYRELLERVSPDIS